MMSLPASKIAPTSSHPCGCLQAIRKVAVYTQCAEKTVKKKKKKSPHPETKYLPVVFLPVDMGRFLVQYYNHEH